MVLAIIKQQVITCIITQKVFKNKAIRASLKVKIGTSGRSWSDSPIKCPVALAQIRSKLFMSKGLLDTVNDQFNYFVTKHNFVVIEIYFNQFKILS